MDPAALRFRRKTGARNLEFEQSNEVSEREVLLFCFAWRMARQRIGLPIERWCRFRSACEFAKFVVESSG